MSPSHGELDGARGAVSRPTLVAAAVAAAALLIIYIRECGRRDVRYVARPHDGFTDVVRMGQVAITATPPLSCSPVSSLLLTGRCILPCTIRPIHTIAPHGGWGQGRGRGGHAVSGCWTWTV